jgi:ubiquinone/menaquinone biosynthesis C-methylase UbiE
MCDIEEKYVHEVYNQVASHFDETRVAHWDEVKKYVEGLLSKSRVGDLGCGNGKNMLIRSDLDWQGCDGSEAMVKICCDKGLNCCLGNLKSLPFNDDEFDHAICIAVVHHLATREHRIHVIKELIRVTKNGGSIMIQVWGNTNSNYQDEQDRLVRWRLKGQYNETTANQSCDYYRFYHYFNDGELEELCRVAGNNHISRSFTTHDNYGVIILVQK